MLLEPVLLVAIHLFYISLSACVPTLLFSQHSLTGSTGIYLFQPLAEIAFHFI